MVLLLLNATQSTPLGREVALTPSEKSIVLTFDDGPRPWILPEILDFLKQEKIQGTFFVQGWQVEKYPELTRRVMREGHEVANHTYGHTSIPEFIKKKGKQWVLDDIERGASVIEKVTGRRPFFFRPRSWLIDEYNKMPISCDEFFKEHTRITDKGPRVILPDNRIYKEELMCPYGRGKYIIQVLDDSKLSAEHRRVRDVNSVDYEFHERYQKDRTGTTVALVENVKRAIARREKDGVSQHVLTFHELPVSLAALKILVPYWRSQGYQFISLRKAYGL